MAVEILPFPNITGATPEEQIRQLVDYLSQFKEELEFILDAMQSGKNVSAQTIEETVHKIYTAGISVSDVIGSYAFKNALKKNRPVFSVNVDTGELEYEYKEV